MKISDADYRPRQRSRSVPSTPRRKIPFVRILILLVAAGAVYWHFDSIWPRLHSGEKKNPANASSGSDRMDANGKPAWIFSADSAKAFLNCGKTSAAECCESLNGLHAGLCGQAGAFTQKAVWLNRLRLPVARKFEVKIQSPEPDVKAFTLTAVEGRDKNGKFHFWHRAESSLWCDSSGECLTPDAPRLPLVQGNLVTDADKGEPVSRWSSSHAEVFPVLPGRIILIDSITLGRYRITLYHGRELYTTYEPLEHLASGLKIGAEVSAHKLLGETARDSLSPSESAHSLLFKVEQSGMPLDAAEFLAVEDRKPNAP